METNLKVRFKKYTATVKRKCYTILVPEGIDSLKTDGFSNGYGGYVQVDRKAVEALLATAYLLGEGKPVLVYIPNRKNEDIPIYLYDTYSRSEALRCVLQAKKWAEQRNLIFGNHNLQFPVGCWKEAQRQIVKQKPKIITYKFNQDKVFRDFEQKRFRWEKTSAFYKQYSERRTINTEAFFIWSKAKFWEWFTILKKYWDEDLEASMKGTFEYGYISDSNCCSIPLQDTNQGRLVLEFFDRELYWKYAMVEYAGKSTPQYQKWR